jgi:hypothetical protein
MLAVPIDQGFDTPLTKIGVGGLVSVILSNAVAIAAVILLFLLIFGGISIIMGAGQQDPQKIGRGRQAATAAIVGFILIFAAYWIIQLVEILTGVAILNPGI